MKSLKSLIILMHCVIKVVEYENGMEIMIMLQIGEDPMNFIVMVLHIENFYLLKV